MEVLCFFAGIVICYAHIVEILPFIFIAYWFKRNYFLFICVGLGCCWAYFHQLFNNDNLITTQQTLNHVMLKGVVASIPKLNNNKTQFKLQLISINASKNNGLVWINCYQNCPKLQIGETWSFRASLKRPKNHVLAGESNPKYWMMSNHITWFGVINTKNAKDAKKIAEPSRSWRFQIFRTCLAQDLENILINDKTLGLIQGLTLGITTHIDKWQWELFRRTGTTHLVVISGEHIGLIAGVSFFIARFFFSRLTLIIKYLPAQRIAACMAFAAAYFYAFLTGLEAPIERALIGFCVLSLRYFIANKFTIWQAWRYALLIIILLEPHTVVTPGLYLSFIAVAILVLVSQRFPNTGYRQMLILQVSCLIGLMPLTLYAFSYASLNGFFVNLITIPWVSLVIVPASLIGLILIQFLPWYGFLWPAKISSDLFFLGLQFLDTFSWININLYLDNIFNLFCLMLALTLIVLLPIKLLLPLYTALVCFAILPQHKKLAQQEAKVIVFDVGQGLSVLVATTHHILLYDSGGAFYQGGDWASFKIIPYLLLHHIKQLDGLIISHEDLDHRGGMKSLEQKFTIKHLWVNDPNYYKRGENCHKIKPWEWDGVFFRFFSLKQGFASRNNTCCVLQVITPYGSLLLPGDIEAKAENYLVAQYGKILQADYLVVPHHGSNTSSSLIFLQTVSPKKAFISSGLNNRFHFPHRKTLDTYKQLHIALLNTATYGSIEVQLTKK